LKSKRRALLCYFFFVGAGDGVNTVEVGTATGAAAEGAA